ncbi:NMDA receptor-regulated protein 1-domain-containing protein [Trichophaea hybrida]|nr:NMDA receptor-regulated protein 1-domain-containing protein [Trichophaea hybrida]
MPTQQPLASKDAALFRQVLKCYEQKQYKKGLKSCEQILRKNPKHGETLAMKGLITNSMGKTEEAFTIAKEALRQDMKSHVCWHVYGLLYRSEKNFEESIKAYKMALKFEPESQQILRDLALLQIQMRNYDGYVETRKTILQTRPQLRQNWTAVAIAYHLAGQLDEAENVLVKYEETIQGTAPKWDVEHWEACLYKNRIIAESGDIKRALEHLESIAKNCLDKVAVLESRAEYLLKLGQKEDAERAYRVLLDRNPEQRAYYVGLEQALGVKADNRKEAKYIYEEYATKFERSDAPQRIPLDFLEGDDFRQAVDTYLQAKLKKGVPSTFANIKALYADNAKRETIFELVHSYYEAQEKETGETNGSLAPSNFRLWTLYFLAQHYDHYRTRDMDKALQYLNKAIELSPATVELHMTIARVYKHAGDLENAMKKMDEARNLDKSDRYINTKTAKYQLRNDHNDDALKTMSLFTRNEANGGPLGDLLEMQCIWYITEDAESYLRQNQLGLVLKRYQSLWDVFEVWAEDQFDFHSFSLRKGQIRAYVDMLKWEDTLKSHPKFSRAALGAINAYIKLSDYPVLGQGAMTNGDAAKYESMTEAERKRAMKKAKKESQKAQEKQAAAAAIKKDDKNKNAQVAEGEVKKEDTDPHGIALARTETPLEEAWKWLRPLLEMSPERLETQLAGFEVQLRRRKWPLALQCLNKAKELTPEDPRIHNLIVRLRHAVNTLPVEEVFNPPESKQLLLDEVDKVLSKDTDLLKYNDEFLEKNKGSAAHMRSALQISALLKPEVKCVTPLLSTLESGSTTLEEAVEGLKLLIDLRLDDKMYKEQAASKFPLAKAFKMTKQ